MPVYLELGWLRQRITKLWLSIEGVVTTCLGGIWG
jgi:hypothetical protein